MSENIIFEQIKLGACVIPLFRVILSGKIYLCLYFCDLRSSSRSSARAISIQGHENVNPEVKNVKVSFLTKTNSRGRVVRRFDIILTE